MARLVMAVIMPMENSMTKAGTPRPSIRPNTCSRGRTGTKKSAPRRLRKCRRSIRQLSSGPSAVAQAAPTIPMSKGYINSQSSAIFARDPTASAVMACTGCPSLRTRPPSRKLRIMKGDRDRMIDRYVTTSPRIASVLPRKKASGRIRRFPSTESSKPAATAAIRACMAHSRASSSRCLARARDTSTPHPDAMAMDSAIMNSSIGTATPAAAMASRPRRSR